MPARTAAAPNAFEQRLPIKLRVVPVQIDVPGALEDDQPGVVDQIGQRSGRVASV
jgi:hypothetical protein